MGMLTDRYRAAMPTAIESWPPALAALSFETISIALSRDERHALRTVLLEQQGDAYDGDPEPIKESIDAITRRVDEAIASFGETGAFVKLSLRSPKDSWLGIGGTGFRATSGALAMKLILDSTERMTEDAIACEESDFPLLIHVRRWATIKPYAEFRCFMRGRQLVGISQYNYDECDAFPNVIDHAERIKTSIEDFFREFSERCHIETIVFDVAFVGNEPIWNEVPRLIEINPFDTEAFGTDPCLFRDRMFDASFRYLGDGSHTPRSRPDRESPLYVVDEAIRTPESEQTQKTME